MRVFAEKIAAIRKIRDWLTAEDYFYLKVLLSSVVGIATMTIITAIFLGVAVHEHRVGRLRTHALDTLQLANKLENEIATVETSHRAYLLTGDPKHLEPFQRHTAMIQSRIDQLIGLVAEDSTQRKRIKNVKNEVQSWLEKIGAPTIARANDTNGAPPAPAAGTSVPSLQPARELLRQMQDAAQIVLNVQMKNDQWASVSYQVLVFAPKLESVATQMETAEANFLVSGDKNNLEAYRHAAGEFVAFHGHLSVLCADNPAQSAALAKIQAQISQWQQLVAVPEITARQENKNVAAMVATGEGRRRMDEVRLAISDFQRTEAAMYEHEVFRIGIRRLLKTIGIGLLCLLAIGFLVASGWYSFVAYVRHLRKLESAEGQTRSIIECTLDGVVTINGEGVVKTMNPAAERMFAVTATAMIGQNISKIIPQRLFLHDLATTGRGSLMAMGLRQNDYSFPIEISLSEIGGDARRHFVALIRDVGERKRSEETLKHIGIGVSSATGEEFLRSLIKQLSRALQTNFAFVVEMERSHGDHLCTLVLAEQGQIRRRGNYSIEGTACEDVLKRGFRAFGSGVAATFPDDELLAELKVESFVGMPLLDHKGRTVGLMGVLDTQPMENMQIAESTLQIFAARAGAELERKRFEEDLERESERLAVTLRSIGDGFIATDEKGCIVLINKVAETMTGWSHESAIGKPLGDIFCLVNERTRKVSQNAVQRIIETGAVVGNAAQAILLSREKKQYLVESSAAPIRDRHNRKLGVVLVFRDITEKQRAEEEHAKAEKLESLGVAAGGIAHDFNNLLTAIIGNISLSLLAASPHNESTDLLRVAKKAGIRAQELAGQLLTFAKGGAPVKKTAAIGPLIRDTVSFSIRGTSTRTVVESPEDLWPVDIDSGQISQVLTNLAINADQAMPAGGTLRVLCDNFELETATPTLAPLNPGKYVRVVVEDEGGGIDEENLTKIFDPYFTTKSKGSGLGLATAYSIIKNHEGLITVKSTPRAGSRFTIYLPASSKPVEVQKLRDESPASGTGRVLVLDDEEVICSLVSHALSPLGYDVTEATDALSAIRFYEEGIKNGHPFDLVITDLTIPGGMGGAEALKKLREIDPRVKAIVSSGYAMDPVMSRYKEYGFSGMIAKPYEIADLGHVVHEVLGAPNVNFVEPELLEARVA